MQENVWRIAFRRGSEGTSEVLIVACDVLKPCLGSCNCRVKVEKPANNTRRKRRFRPISKPEQRFHGYPVARYHLQTVLLRQEAGMRQKTQSKKRKHTRKQSLFYTTHGKIGPIGIERLDPNAESGVATNITPYSHRHWSTLHAENPAICERRG